MATVSLESISSSGMRVHGIFTSSFEQPGAARPICFARALLMPSAVFMLVACARQTADLREEPAAPTSATFQLAPTAASSQPAGNLLAAAVGTEAASAVAPEAGAASSGCVNGWSTPERGSALRGAVLDMMRSRAGERFIIEEMRYFVGPEDVEVLGVRGDVERWYVKASTEAEPRRRLRWLARRAAVGSGIDAVAPFESTGYGSGVWHRPDAADERFADPFERPCEGTRPGEKCMGLPREVLGCLSGT